MRIIYDAPGQTCNRLWSYVSSVARCVAEHSRMVVVFHDETIEDFPAFLHCKFIYFPLWNKWFLEHCNGWKYYKGLLWRVKFKYKKKLDSIARPLRLTNGWQTRFESQYVRETLPELQRIFRPKEEIMQKAQTMVASLRKDADIVVGVHIRRGDYATWLGGRFFFDISVYHQFMLRVQQLYADRRVAFFISSNEDFPIDIFEGCRCQRFGREPSGAVLDLYTLSLCDRLIGPFSTYSRWASFIGEVPLCFMESKDQEVKEESFSKIVDFFHFENGKEIYDW